MHGFLFRHRHSYPVGNEINSRTRLGAFTLEKEQHFDLYGVTFEPCFYSYSFHQRQSNASTANTHWLLVAIFPSPPLTLCSFLSHLDLYKSIFSQYPRPTTSRALLLQKAQLSLPTFIRSCISVSPLSEFQESIVFLGVCCGRLDDWRMEFVRGLF